MNKFWLYLVRIIFITLIAFEAANLFGLIKFELDYSWFGLIITALVVWIGIEIIYYFHKYKLGRNLPAIVLIFPTLSILIDALGDILRFYSRFEWYDQMAHFIGGISTALVLFYIIIVYAKYKKYNIGIGFASVYALFGTGFFAAIYEIEEYAETIILKNNRLGDRFDIPDDLLWTILGGIIGVLIIMLFLNFRKKK